MDQNGSAKKRKRRSSNQTIAKQGRPSKATPELITELCKALAEGLTEEEAAACSFISVGTLKEWKSSAAFSDELARARSDYIRSTLAKAAAEPKSWQRFTWVLERARI